VVDDEEYNRITLSTFLGEVGFQVTTAATGDEALAIARQQPLHAVFLDVNLPGMSGPEIARALRAMENLEPSLPIIATTAYTTAEKRRLCSEAGMTAFLSKPVTLEKIHSALASASSTQRAAPSFHVPGPDQTHDPVASLRMLARRKGVSLEAEIALFLTELAGEERLLADALKQRELAVVGDAAHRLVGRLAFIHALVEAQLAREIEASSMNEFWDQADASAARLANLLPGLRDRITAAG
jgi:CheY-like chemotaxis protein